MPHAIVAKTTGSLAPIPGRCGAKLKYTDPPKYCKKWPMRGRTRCERDGGRSRVGADHPGLKTGLGSKFGYLTPRVFEAFNAAFQDEQLMDLTADVALLEVVKQEAAAGWQAGESVEAWRELKGAFTTLEKAKTRAQARAAMATLRQLIGHGNQAAARDDLAKTIERKGKLVKTRQQLLTDSEELVPAKRIAVFISVMATLVREFIQDDDRRREFSRRFVGLLGPRLRPQGGAGPEPVASGDGAEPGGPAQDPAH